ncbi:hypothetical protein TNCV_4133761 [Trichonephila clavipes]|uniref:Uncharacterized protein n=1 Tax=Trichonephila clavipes TaxID=2585209 RepID=A0A8X6VHR6_TRICX|nr:hypothetical protein TNCV_4133761 [Trichonephila clavipes]
MTLKCWRTFIPLRLNVPSLSAWCGSLESAFLLKSESKRSVTLNRAYSALVVIDRARAAPPRYKAWPLICDVTTSREKSSIAYGASLMHFFEYFLL